MTADTILEPTAVVTAFLRYDGRILLVQRSRRVGTYQGRWSAISGYLEDDTPLLQARREIREETGLPDDEIHLVAEGEPIAIPAPELAKLWMVHPFLFEIDDPEHIRLDWENVEFCWIAPDEIKDYPTVPKLEEALQACLKLT
ncbi:MAG: NUDIX domain-containing protein [Gammaproteobacteria bacterium]|nr:NUDIX domain-containing protein [Gammaproteobacteria bacterium]